MNQDSAFSKKKDIVSFPRESTYSIGNVTYRVESHFIEDGKTLPEMVKRVLLENICKNIHRTFAESRMERYNQGATLLIWRQGRRNYGKAK